MEPLVCAYWTAKSGISADEYEDAFAFSTNSRHFAIADGATESSFADRWARSLVEKYSKEPLAQSEGRLPLADWIRPLQQQWHDAIHWDSLPWFAEEKARAGAFATFLGVSFSSLGSRKTTGALTRFFRRAESDRLIWRACAVGDSCLFQVRGGALIKAFPLTRSEQFNSRPILLCSNPRNNNGVWDAVQLAEGDCQEGDIFFALTDALAQWFLSDSEAGGAPWARLADLQSAKQFELFVEQLRSTKAIRNDDTTMLSFRWTRETGKSGRTAWFSRKTKP